MIHVGPGFVFSLPAVSLDINYYSTIRGHPNLRDDGLSRTLILRHFIHQRTRGIDRHTST